MLHSGLQSNIDQMSKANYNGISHVLVMSCGHVKNVLDLIGLVCMNEYNHFRSGTYFFIQLIHGQVCEASEPE